MAEPERTCSGCGERRPKSSLVRLSVGPSGRVEAGLRGGRGTYVCPDAACLERALGRRAVQRRLRTDAAPAEDLTERVLAGLAEGRKPAGC